MSFSRRVLQIQPSQTLAVTARVAELRQQGKEVLSLGAGEPDFDTPQVIKNAAIDAIQQGYTKYTPSSGALKLKEAVCDKYQRERNVSYSPSEVLISSGAKHSIINALLALCDSGDQIIIPAPFWTSYPEQARFVGAEPVIIETDESAGFKISAAQLQKAITSRTKVLLLNSPSNPTGAVYSKAELNDIAEVILNHDFFVIYDEIYEKIVYDDAKHFSLTEYPEFRDRTILVNGVSKSYAMTGWRIGYMLAASDIIKACNRIQSHTTSNACSVSQMAAVAALEAGEDAVREMVSAFAERRKYIVEQVAGLPGFTCRMPEGAFYLFADIAGCLGLKKNDLKIASSIDLCNYLLEEAGVAIVPGEAFGSDRHVRLSYATSMKDLEKAVSRLGNALNQLHG